MFGWLRRKNKDYLVIRNIQCVKYTGDNDIALLNFVNKYCPSHNKIAFCKDVNPSITNRYSDRWESIQPSNYLCLINDSNVVVLSSKEFAEVMSNKIETVIITDKD